MLRFQSHTALKRCALAAVTLILFSGVARTADAPPPQRITPGKAIVPDGAGMRRIWGELVSLDLKTRTGKFRNESNDEVMEFTVLPYAELLHHATFGDLQDFRVGERAIFRLHQDEQGKWRYLTYIQDEMNMLHNHKEWYWIDAIDPQKHEFTCHWPTADGAIMREKAMIVRADEHSRFWRGGQPVSFADVKVGDKIEAKSHGTGKGKERVLWEAFLDTESLLKFQAEQKPVHQQRMRDEGLPGYVDTVDGGKVQLTLFRETVEFAPQIKPGMTVRLAPAGTDRKPTVEPAAGTVTSVKQQGVLCAVVLQLNDASPPAGTPPTALARLWVPALFQKQ